MSNRTTLLDLISSSQAQKEVTANAMFDAASPAMLFGRRASTTSALTWGYYGGALLVGGTPTPIANGTVALTASATNYVQANSSGVVSVNTTGFIAGAIPLYTIVAGVSTVTSYTDQRTLAMGAGSGTSSVFGASGTSHSAGDVPDPGGTAGTTRVLCEDATWKAQPYDVGGSVSGKPAASLVLLRYPFPRAVAFPAGLTGSYGVCGTTATASAAFTVAKNGTSVGTMTFAIGANTATFTMASSTTFAAGDVLTVTAPGTQDTTLADVGFALAGTR